MAGRLKNYRFEWKLALFTFLLLPVLLTLGFWQLEREEEKLALQELYEERLTSQPVSIEAVNLTGNPQYLSVRLRGRFDNAHNFLLDNKIHEGRVGYELITPFQTEGGWTVMVNRGWMPGDPDRRNLPEIRPVTGDVIVSGTVYVPVGEQFVLGDGGAAPSWPRVVQEIDIEEMARAAGWEGNTELFPYSVRLAADAQGVLVRNWPVVSMSAATHRGYAVQWFTLAAVLFGLYFFFSTRPEQDDDEGDSA